MILRGNYVPLVRKGGGKQILFLHGYLSCKESFYYQTEYFSRRFTVIAPDICGFGASPPLTVPYGVADFSEWLFQFIAAQKLDKPHIVAHSFGARVAVKLLSERPELCDKLVITGGAGIVKPRSRAYTRRVTAYRRVKKFFPEFAEKHFGSKEFRTLSPVMRESYKKIVNEDLKDCAAKIANKTLLLYGESDTVTPPCEEGEIFHSLIRGSVFKTMAGGHFCFCEYPQTFNLLAEEFLNEQ